MAAPASNKSSIGLTEFLILCALLGGTLRYRTLLWQLAWGELTTRVPAVVVIGQYPHTSAILAGGVLALILVGIVSLHGSLTKRNAETLPSALDVCDLADEERIDWLLPNVLGRGVLTLISAPPGGGKGWWLWALLLAMQERHGFFGLPVHRPWRPRKGWWRWWKRATPLRVLWLTEESASFKKTARDFGIRRGLVRTVQRQHVQYDTWPELVAFVRREAWRQQCAYVFVDTIGAWCPEAEVDRTHANAVMGEARRQWAAAGLGVLFVHHDTKAGGEYGAGVSGTYGLVGAVDVLVELRRVKDRPDARRMLVSRRFGPQDRTATLDAHHRYVADDAALAAFDKQLDVVAPRAPAKPPLAPHLAGIVDLLRRTGAGGLSTTAVQQSSGTAKATVLRYLAQLAQDGYVTQDKEGNGFVWRAADLPAPPPTADPAYVRYLGSPEWEHKRRAVLERSDCQCEVCGLRVEASEMEVHHSPKAYALVPDEPISLLAGLCPGCHRRAHAS